MRYQYTSPGSYNLFRRDQFSLPQGVKNIIIANLIVFILLELSGMKLNIFRSFGLIPSQIIFEFKIWQLFTYMFLHDGFFHILLNMLFLWMFGREIEMIWGRDEFYKYYFVTGVGAGLLNSIFSFNSSIPVVGASGAVFGILLAFALIYPNREVLLYGIVPIKVKFMVLGLAAIAFFSTIMIQQSRISHLTHLSGMISGIIYLRWNFIKSIINNLLNQHKRTTSTKVYHMKSKKPKMDEDILIKKNVDKVLDKLNTEGWENLSDAEQQILYQASEIYSNRDQPN